MGFYLHTVLEKFEDCSNNLPQQELYLVLFDDKGFKISIDAGEISKIFSGKKYPSSSIVSVCDQDNAKDIIKNDIKENLIINKKLDNIPKLVKDIKNLIQEDNTLMVDVRNKLIEMEVYDYDSAANFLANVIIESVPRRNKKIDNDYKKNEKNMFTNVIKQLKNYYSYDENLDYISPILSLKSKQLYISDLMKIIIKNNVNIYGEGGIGKTTLLKNAINFQYSSILKGKSIIPIFIELNKYSKFDENNSFIINQIYEYLLLFDINIKKYDILKIMKNINSKFKFLIFCDGYNEVNLSYKYNIINELNNILNDYKNINIVITSRTIIKELDYINIKINYLSEDTIINTINRYCNTNLTCNDIRNLKELLRIPMFLEKYVLLYNMNEIPNVVNKGSLLHEYVSKYIFRKSIKSKWKDKNFINFLLNYLLPYIAYQMSINFEFSINRKRFFEIINKEYPIKKDNRIDCEKCIFKNKDWLITYNFTESFDYIEKFYEKRQFPDISRNADIIEFYIDYFDYMELGVDGKYKFRHEYYLRYFSALYIIQVLKCNNTELLYKINNNWNEDIIEILSELSLIKDCECDFQWLLDVILINENRLLVENIGEFYGNKKYKTKNLAKAYRFYKLGAKLGSANCMWRAGVARRLGLGVKENYFESVKWHHMGNNTNIYEDENKDRIAKSTYTYSSPHDGKIEKQFFVAKGDLVHVIHKSNEMYLCEIKLENEQYVLRYLPLDVFETTPKTTHWNWHEKDTAIIIKDTAVYANNYKFERGLLCHLEIGENVVYLPNPVVEKNTGFSKIQFAYPDNKNILCRGWIPNDSHDGGCIHQWVTESMLEYPYKEYSYCKNCNIFHNNSEEIEKLLENDSKNKPIDF